MSVIEDVARDWPAFFAWPPSVRCAVTVLTTRTVPGEVVGPLSAALARLPPGDGGGPVLVHEVKGTWEAASAPVRRMLPWARHPERWPMAPHAWERGGEAEGVSTMACMALGAADDPDAAAATILRRGPLGGTVLLDWAAGDHAELCAALMDASDRRPAQGINPGIVAAAVERGYGALRLWTEPYPVYWEVTVDVFAQTGRLPRADVHHD